MRRREAFVLACIVLIVMAVMTLMFQHTPAAHDSIDQRRLSALEAQFRFRQGEGKRRRENEHTAQDPQLLARMARLESASEGLEKGMADRLKSIDKQIAHHASLKTRGSRKAGDGTARDVSQPPSPVGSDPKQAAILQGVSHRLDMVETAMRKSGGGAAAVALDQEPYGLAGFGIPFEENWNETDPWTGESPLPG